MNTRLNKIKNRVKNTVKDHAPELIAFGASALALVAYAAYVTKKSDDSETGFHHQGDIHIMGSDGEGYAVVSDLEALLLIEGNSKTRYKLDEDHYYSFERIDTPNED